MKEKFTKVPKLPFKFDDLSKADTIRIVLLTIFTLSYAVVAFDWFYFGSLTIGEYFPTIGYRLCDFVILLQLAIPYVTVVFLLVRSFEHWIGGLRIQLIIYGIIAFLFVTLMIFTDSDGFGFAMLLSVAIAFFVIFALQLAILGIREWVRKKIGDRKKEPILGCGLLGVSILALLLIFLIMPSHRQVGKELNEVLQNPGDLHSVDNYLEYETVAAIPEEVWSELLTTIEVDTPIKEEYPVFYGGMRFAVAICTAVHPDREIRILWYDRDDCVEILYRGAWYYADDSAFEAKIAEYLPPEQAD